MWTSSCRGFAGLTGGSQSQGIPSFRTNVYVSPSGSDSNDGSLASPWLTLAHAQTAVRSTLSVMNADLNVNIAGGTYTLASALAFASADSGRNGHAVNWIAVNGQTPIISGGVQISGWTLVDAGNNIWRAASGGIATRLLFVNGVRAGQVRSSGGFSGVSRSSNVYTFASSNPLGSYARPQDVELVYRVSWTESRIKVASVSGLTVTMQPTPFSIGLLTSAPIDMPTWWENAFELLSSSTTGQFYLDPSANFFYYVPRPGEDMTTATVIAPVLSQLATVTGASNLTFQKLTFQHTTWELPLANTGYISVQSNAYRTSISLPASLGAFPKIPPALQITGACLNVTIKRCILTKLGGAGYSIEGGSDTCYGIGNTVYDVSANGVEISDPREAFASPFTNNILIDDNYVHDVGQEFHDSCGIMAWYCSNSTINDNDIRNIPYSGIAIGWGWGDASALPTAAGGNTISDNYIVNAMNTMRDGGYIYTNSVQSSCSITGNVISVQSQAFGVIGGGIYTDDGSKNYTITGNAVYYMNAQMVEFYTHVNVVSNNITVTGNYFEAGTFQDQNGAISLPGNNSGTPPYSVIQASGLESAYQDIAPFDFNRFLPLVNIDAVTSPLQTPAGSAAIANNDPIGQLTDQSNHAGHVTQSTSGFRPLLKTNYQNGLAVALFDGVDDFVKNEVGTVNKPVAVYLVANLLSAAAQSCLFSGENSGNVELAQGVPNGLRMYEGTAFVTYGAVTAGTFHVYQVLFNGNSGSPLSSLSLDGGTKTTGNPGTVDVSVLQLGMSADGFRPANVAVAQLLVVPHAPTAPEEADIFAQLKSRWATP